MKIMQVHNRYQQTGGEDSVLDAEKALMIRRSNTVVSSVQSNDTIKSLPAKLKAFFNVAYSYSSREWMRLEIIKHQPDVVHVHNFFPLLTPSIYDACVEAGVPVVQTLHNYRTICPGALLMREGNVCEICIKGSAYKSVLHGCYKSSKVGTFAVARMVEYHRKHNTWMSKVSRFIALTEFARKKFIEAGFPEERIKVKSNFIESSDYKVDDLNQERRGALFIGRISQEKGLDTLINAWQKLKVPLRVAGSGPLSNTLSLLDSKLVVTLGMLAHEAVQKEMRKAAFLVMPSKWYEGFPMVLVEAFSQGLPVVASRLGGMAEIVEDGITGLHFEAGNAKDLAEKVQWMHDHPEECQKMGLNARKVFEEKYTAEKNYEILMDIYQEAIDDAKTNKNIV